MTFERKKLSEMEMPVVFSVFARPGLNISKLKSFGFSFDHQLYTGNRREQNDNTFLEWSNGSFTIEGNID